MASVTIVSTDRPDYSRYEVGLSIITVRGICDTQSTPITVTLARTDSYGTLATASVTSSASTPSTFAVSFDLNSSAMNDSDGINRAIQGDYTVSAAPTAGGGAKSAPITVSIVSLAEMHNRWLYGATLYSSEIVLPKQQPQRLPVTFLEVNPFFQKGPYQLTYDPNAGVGFAGGPPVAVTPNTGLVQLVLLDQREADWARVQVDTMQLPSGATSETIVLDQAQMSDHDVLMYMRQATAWLENKLGWFVEPRFCVSDRLTAKFPTYERQLDGAGYYGTFNWTDTFPNIVLPTQHLLAIKDLEGWYNQQAIINVPSTWWQRNEMEGNIELVPTTGQANTIQFLSSGVFFASEYKLIPDFWQYAVTCGLRDLNFDRAIVREAIAKKAAIETLLVAGAAYRAGISSRSTSRDNVSFSETYTSSAMYGIYSHLTIPYDEWLEKNVPTIRRRIGGLVMTTLM